MARRKEQSVIVSGRSPIISVALGLCFTVAIAYNALGRQDARHPAPFEGFWSLGTDASETPHRTLQPRHTRLPAPKPDQLVSSLQRELTEIGMYDGSVDGLIGPKTRAAIARYQRENQMTASGEPTEQLLEHMKFNRQIRDAVKQSPVSIAPDKKKRIRLVQTGLSELGYTPGPVDGVLGDQTVQAIRDFEKDRRMKVTGKISDGLIRELHETTGLSSLSNNSDNG